MTALSFRIERKKKEKKTKSLLVYTMRDGVYNAMELVGHGLIEAARSRAQTNDLIGFAAILSIRSMRGPGTGAFIVLANWCLKPHGLAKTAPV